MNNFLLVSNIILWLASGFLGFLLLGTLRSLGLLSWRLEQLEATTPKRLGRDGLKPGKRAPDFTLPSVDGNEVALHDFRGRKVLLVFTQSGCAPCKAIVPELNRLGANEQIRSSTMATSKQRGSGAQNCKLASRCSPRKCSAFPKSMRSSPPPSLSSSTRKA